MNENLESGPSITVEFRQTPSEVATVAEYVLLQVPAFSVGTRFTLPICCAVIVGFCAVSFFKRGQLDAGHITVTILLLLIGLTMPRFIRRSWIGSEASIRKQLLESARDSPIRVTISREGVKEVASGICRATPWTSINQIVELGQIVLFLSNADGGIFTVVVYVPGSAFDSRIERDTFLDAARDWHRGGNTGGMPPRLGERSELPQLASTTDRSPPDSNAMHQRIHAETTLEVSDFIEMYRRLFARLPPHRVHWLFWLFLVCAITGTLVYAVMAPVGRVMGTAISLWCGILTIFYAIWKYRRFQMNPCVHAILKSAPEHLLRFPTIWEFDETGLATQDALERTHYSWSAIAAFEWLEPGLVVTFVNKEVAIIPSRAFAAETDPQRLLARLRIWHSGCRQQAVQSAP